MIAFIKTIHIAALVLWCAALLSLPMLLALHGSVRQAATRVQAQARYDRFRWLTHWTYRGLATPAAIVAIAAGTVLIFGAQVFEIWLLAKLAAVAGMVLAHAWLGHLVVQSGEKPVDWRMPWPGLSWVLSVPCMLAVLALVLLKPDLAVWAQALPDWLTHPLELDVAALLEQGLRWLGIDWRPTQGVSA